MRKRKKKDFTEAFKWANSELKTGRDIMAIVFSWGGTFPEEIIDYLKLEYNKQRQEKITNEILDIGSESAAFAYE